MVRHEEVVEDRVDDLSQQARRDGKRRGAQPRSAVDDEPEDAPVGLAVQLPAPREGDVLDADEPSADDDDSEGVDLDVAPEQAPVVAQRIARAPDGTQRYGEAVVRQLLGARFIREEPHASPTRFG